MEYNHKAITEKVNYARLMRDPKKLHWEKLYAYLMTTQVPPTEYHKKFAGAIKAMKDPDTYTWDKAMASPYKKEFLEATDVEIRELTQHSTWYKNLASSTTNKIVPSQWVFCIKRTADSKIKKFKARLVL